MILVVEDDEATAELISHYLLEGGYAVAVATDGEQALQMARELIPAAITLDVYLPKKSGFDVLIELKDNLETREIPIIMVSVSDNREVGVSMGAVDFLVKPVDRDHILRTLKKIQVDRVASPLRVLVVDDDARVTRMIAENLGQMGYEVFQAHSGQEGISSAHDNAPDVIILDLVMSEETGLDVVDKLRGSQETAGTPVLLYTCRDLTDQERKVLNERVQAIVPKSGGKGRLLEFVETLRRKRLEAAS